MNGIDAFTSRSLRMLRLGGDMSIGFSIQRSTKAMLNLKPRAAEVHRRQKLRTWTKRQLAAELSDHLLDEVLAAAGGAEHSILALRDAVRRAQAWTDQLDPKPTPDVVPTNIGDVSVIDAWYEFANLLYLGPASWKSG